MNMNVNSLPYNAVLQHALLNPTLPDLMNIIPYLTLPKLTALQLTQPNQTGLDLEYEYDFEFPALPCITRLHRAALNNTLPNEYEFLTLPSRSEPNRTVPHTAKPDKTSEYEYDFLALPHPTPPNPSQR